VTPDQRPADDQALNAVVARAATDLAFRRQLLTDPRRAILDAFGVTIPADFRIKFIEKDSSVDALVVLPDVHRVEAEDGAVSDADLEAVSGGAAHHHNAKLAWKGHA
jgi:hypothetical protein